MSLLVDYDLYPEEQQLIESEVQKYPHLKDVDITLFSDLYPAIKFGYSEFKYLLNPFRKLYKEAAEKFIGNYNKSFREAIDEIFDRRRDLLRIASTHFIEDLHNAEITMAEKIQSMCAMMAGLIEARQQAQKQSQQQSNSSQNSSSGPGGPGQGASGAGVNIPGIYSDFAEVLDTLSPPEAGNEEDTDLDADTDDEWDGTQSSSGRGKIRAKDIQHKLRSKDRVQNIMRIFKQVSSSDDLKLFKLANNFSQVLREKVSEEIEDVKIGEKRTFRKMRNLKELHNIALSSWSLPDEIFDIRLMKKDFIVEQHQTLVHKSQVLFVLADVSGSMSSFNRMVFMQAILLSLCKNALENRSKIYYRFFDDNIHPYFKVENVKDWNKFLNTVVSVKDQGGTDIPRTLYDTLEIIKGEKLKTAERHVEENIEILLLTDGTEFLAADQIKDRLTVPMHTVLIDPGKGSSDVKSLVDSYSIFSKNVLIAETEDMSKTKDSGIKITGLVEV